MTSQAQEVHAPVIVGPRRGTFFAISLVLSLGMYMLCWLLELHPVMLIASVFYGTLVTSYLAKHNVVWASALGGLAAIAIVLLIKILAAYAAHKTMFAAIAGGAGKPDLDPYADDPIGKGKVVVGMIVALLAVFPIGLIGASVGEHLSMRRQTRSLGS